MSSLTAYQKRLLTLNASIESIRARRLEHQAQASVCEIKTFRQQELVRRLTSQRHSANDQDDVKRTAVEQRLSSVKAELEELYKDAARISQDIAMVYVELLGINQEISAYHSLISADLEKGAKASGGNGL